MEHGDPYVSQIETREKGAWDKVSVVAPNGLIASLFGPVEGRRHDSRMLVDSGLLQKLFW